MSKLDYVVVIPTHNRGIELVGKAVSSALAQTVPPTEVIVVDDGSKEPIAPSLAAHFPGQPVRVVRHEHGKGAQLARLAGVLEATTPVVALLDSDDWWEPHKMADQLAALAAQTGPCLVTSRVWIEGQGAPKTRPHAVLKMNERIEYYLFVRRGLLQTSTHVAARTVMAELLQASAHTQVQHDPSIAIEAQQRGYPVLQIAEPLSHFSCVETHARISTGKNQSAAAEAWLSDYAKCWPRLVWHGYMVNHHVEMLLKGGQTRKALSVFLKHYRIELGWRPFVTLLLNLFRK